MKVVVFAHTPPPHHGQSYMVELMLNGFADRSRGVEAFHVNARFASDIQDIGKFRPAKIWRLAKYIGAALWIRISRGARVLYYIPAPPLKNAIVRDWVILLSCRLFFPKLILHWQAAGLGEWIQNAPGWQRWLTRHALKNTDLSIALNEFSKAETKAFHAAKSDIIPNGIPDPCPDFAAVLKQRRHRKTTASRVVQVLFMSLALREKGLFDAIEGVFRANDLMRESGVDCEFRLSIAGRFFEPSDEVEFRKILENSPPGNKITHLGFVTGAAKTALLADSDIFCFPTYYAAENSPVALIEALAFGLPVVTTKWHSIEDFFPPGYPGVVAPRAPDQVAEALITVAGRDDFEMLRERFLKFYRLDRHLDALARAFHRIETA